MDELFPLLFLKIYISSLYIWIDELFRWCACLSNKCSSIGPLEYNEVFIRLVFSPTPCNDQYAMHVSDDMTACTWTLNYGDHHVSTTATRDSHDATRTHDTTSPDVRLTPSRPHHPSSRAPRAAPHRACLPHL